MTGTPPNPQTVPRQRTPRKTPNGGPARATTANGSASRERILDAAEQLFLEKGFHGTSVHEIASAAGYTTGPLYWAFAGKADICLAVILERWGADDQGSREDVAYTPPESKRDPARAAAAQLLGTSHHSHAQLAVMYEFMVQARRDKRMGECTLELKRQEIARTANMLRELSLPLPLDVERMAAFITALRDGLIVRSFGDPEAAAADPDLIVDGLAALLAAGSSQESP
jgi:AcrR family transcriptional regulator